MLFLKIAQRIKRISVKINKNIDYKVNELKSHFFGSANYT